MATKPKILIIGAHGTVGLALIEQLQDLIGAEAIEIINLKPQDRRNLNAKEDGIRQADLVILCLPDDAVRETVALIDRVNPKARILDASAIHRCAPGWVYGLQQVIPKDQISQARLVANPGCFATACILAARPLPRTHMVFNGITGYSAGGRKAIDNAHQRGYPKLAQFGRLHRHIPEITQYARTSATLTTIVGNWRQGMLVQTSVRIPTQIVLNQYRHFYRNFDEVEVLDASSAAVGYQVDPQSCNGTNKVKLIVAQQPYDYTSVAIVLDNLGKGSAGAAVENLKLMLGQ